MTYGLLSKISSSSINVSLLDHVKNIWLRLEILHVLRSNSSNWYSCESKASVQILKNGSNQYMISVLRYIAFWGFKERPFTNSLCWFDCFSDRKGLLVARKLRSHLCTYLVSYNCIIAYKYITQRRGLWYRENYWLCGKRHEGVLEMT